MVGKGMAHLNTNDGHPCRTSVSHNRHEVRCGRALEKKKGNEENPIPVDKMEILEGKTIRVIWEPREGRRQIRTQLYREKCCTSIATTRFEKIRTSRVEWVAGGNGGAVKELKTSSTEKGYLECSWGRRRRKKEKTDIGYPSQRSLLEEEIDEALEKER